MDNTNQYYLLVMVTDDSGMSSPDVGMMDFLKMTNEELDEWLDNQHTEPVALYDNFEDAAYWLEKLVDQIAGTADEGKVHFDILGMEINPSPPQLLTDLKKEEQILRDTIETILIKLMKQGLVDQLIGEDGKFYYEITDAGREKMDTMPPHLKDYFGLDKKDKDHDDDQWPF